MSRSVPLPAIPTARSATEALPDDIEAGLAGLLDAALDTPSWRDRWLVVSALWHFPGVSSRYVEATARMVTAVGEQLGERSIDCVEAAAFYRLAIHVEWRMAALRYLDASDLDDLSAFVDRNPEFVSFLVQHVGLYPTEESLG